MSNPEYDTQINPPRLLFSNEHVFDSIFAYFLQLYSLKVTPFKRRVIESVMLFTAFISLLVLLKSHICLNHVSSEFLRSIPRRTLRDEIIRIDVTTEKIKGNYTLENSYLKEFSFGNLPMEHYLPLRYFLNISKNQCPLDSALNIYFDVTKVKPNDLDSVIEYSPEYSLLRLSPRLREIFDVPVHLFVIDLETLFSPSNDSIWPFLSNLIGVDILVLYSLSQYSLNFSGYARDVVNGLSYSFSNTKQIGMELLLLSLLTYSIFGFCIFFLINFAYNQIYFLMVNILRRDELHRSISAMGGILTVILSFIGIELIISDFFQNSVISCYVILLLWAKLQFNSIIVHSMTARSVFFYMSGMCELLFYMHHYRYSGVLDRQAMFTCCMFVIHSAFYCLHHYALPEFIIGIRSEMRNESGD